MKTFIVGLCACLCLYIGAQIQTMTANENVLKIPEVPEQVGQIFWEGDDGAEWANSRIPLTAELQFILEDACAANGVPMPVALAVIEVESNFRPDALSCCGCYGLMQLHPAYFPQGLSPADNIRYGVEFLGKLIVSYGDLSAALTAYNVGHDNSTRTYANKVLQAADKWNEIIGETYE